ncbi:RNA-directed DNA polymerase, eukaryota, Reverse transcriptase zinc-binding domain protein [Artemisia annua]|uniref:RNA-directed DNA polymerase, eukaryota, Reverse transcriptase zinc-binding domain protein n=1 Tax=Artemisia annua TaxID=35608 RepID=A0A2U1QNR5_ARTAN|nr:RNA-directed DNA polymerase, eukaryota, Reverse transcriptase zinc-binding domain protein [Artemisia annua]
MGSNMVVKDVICNGEWTWPEEWIVKYPVLNQIQAVNLIDGRDELVWKSKKGKVGKFSVKQAYVDLQIEDEDVTWSKLVWFSQNIPKHAFILWLAIQKRLMTQDRLKNWGSYDMMICPLCCEDMDSHQHLFFTSKFSSAFWKEVCSKIDLQWKEWNGDVVLLIHFSPGLSKHSIFGLQ